MRILTLKSGLALASLIGLLIVPGGAAGQEKVVGPTTAIPLGSPNATPFPEELGGNSGSYSPTVPLDLLPARRGVVPPLALRYAAGLANGPIGAGWSLTFESVIERRSARRGVAGLNWYDGDIYLVDGEELIEIADGTYRALHDARTEYVRVAKEGDVTVAWTASLDGTTRTWGAPDSGSTSISGCKSASDAVRYRQEPSGTVCPPCPGPLCNESCKVLCAEEPVAWHLTRVEDAFGNGFDVVYDKYGGTPLPQSIEYGRTSSVDYHRISFTYEVRADLRVSAADGTPRTLDQRLIGIAVDSIRGGLATAAYEYELDYAVAKCDTQSLLTAVRHMRQVDATASPSSWRTLARFEYQDGGDKGCAPSWDGAADVAVTGSPLSNAPFPCNDEFENEFGYLDCSETKAYYVDSTGKKIDYGYYDSSNGPLMTRTNLVDVDGDARPDLVLLHELCGPEALKAVGGVMGGDPKSAQAPNCSLEARIFLHETGSDGTPKFAYSEALTSSANAFFGYATGGNESTDPHWHVHLVDLDLDGRLDIVRPARGEQVESLDTFKPGVYVLGTVQGWPKESEQGAWWLSKDGPLGHKTFDDYHLTDVNSDGLPDLVSQNEVYYNRGAPPFFEKTKADQGPIIDPTIADAPLSPKTCWKLGETALAPRSYYGTGEYNLSDGFESTTHKWPVDLTDYEITGQEWLWRNTQHADFNGDGVTDRLVAMPWLSTDTSEPSTACGGVGRLDLGTGRGGFVPAGYGFGGATSSIVLEITRAQCWGDDVDGDKCDAAGDESSGPYVPAELLFKYPVNHFGLADFDGNGRLEVLQLCNSTDIDAIDGKLQVVLRDGVKPGFGGNGWSAACPKTSVALGLPATGFIVGGANTPKDDSDDKPLYRGIVAPGQSPFGEAFSTFADLDGDGRPDYVTYRAPVKEWEVPSNPPPDTGSVQWHRNLGVGSQNRLTAIESPRGGRTELTWGSSAKGDNRIPINVDVIESVRGARGETRFRFSDGAYHSGKFLGFGRVEVADAGGARSVRRYNTTVAMQGQLVSEAFWRADDRLLKMSVNVYGKPNNCGAVSLPFDLSPPYENLLLRACEVDLANASGLAPDVDALTAQCDDFAGECSGEKCPPSGWQSKEVLSRTVWAVARGAIPEDVSTKASGLETLTKVRQYVMGELDIAENTCPVTGALAGTGFTPVDGSDAPSLDEADPDATLDGAVAATGFAAPALKLSGLVVPDSTGGPDVTSVFRVAETDYDFLIGKPVQVRRINDATTTKDTTILDIQWENGDASFEWPRLKQQETTDASGKRFDKRTWHDYVRDLWGTEKQHASTGTQIRSRRRSIDSATGEVLVETGWNDSAPRAFLYDACGEVRAEANAIGHWRMTTRDARCLSAQIVTSAGYLEQHQYDGYGRATSRTVTAPPSPSEASRVVFVDPSSSPDPAQAGATPAEIAVLAEPDGSETLVRTHVDEHDRVVLETRCRRKAGLPETWDVSPDEAYACDPAEPAVHRLTGRYAATGEVAWESLPFDSTEAADYTWRGFKHDDLRRVAAERQADGTHLYWGWDLRRRYAWDPLGVETTIEVATLSETRRVAGAFRGSTTRNAFDQVVQEKDAAGAATTFEYDVFQRRYRTILPKVAVLASGAAAPVQAQPVELIIHGLDDLPLLSINPTGAATLQLHDTIGRPVMTLGPDGAITAMATYKDGPYPGRGVTTIDDRGNARTESRDARDRVWRTVASDGARTTTLYDVRGRVAEVRRPWGERELTMYDRFERPVQTTRVMGKVSATTTTERDARGWPVRTVDGDGVVQRRAYNAMGQVTEVRAGEPGTIGTRRLEAYSYDDAGRVELATTNGATRRFTRDDLGRVLVEQTGWDKSATPKALATVTREYDAADRPTSEENALGERTERTYDALGRLMTTTWKDAVGTVLGTTSLDYDAVGRTTRSTDERGLSSRTEYDAYGRVVGVKPPGLGKAVTAWIRKPPHPISGAPTTSLLRMTVAPTGEISRAYVDGEGRDWFAVGPDGVSVQNVYSSGRLTRQRRYRADKTLDAVKITTYYARSDRTLRKLDWVEPADEKACVAYSAACPVAPITSTWSPAGRLVVLSDAAGNATKYEYAPQTGLIAAAHLGGVTTIRWDYDPDWAVATDQRTGPTSSAIATHMDWDRYVRIDGLTRQQAKSGTSESIEYGYDEAGRRIEAKLSRNGKAESALDWAYDGRGRIVEKTLVAGTLATESLGWSWLPNGLLESTTYPSGRMVRYDYAATSNLLNDIVVDGGTGPDTAVASFGKYDTSGRPKEIFLAKGQPQEVKVARTFKQGRESSRTITGVSSAGARVETFTYDEIGRLDGIDVKEGGAAVNAISFGYDPRHHVTSEKWATPSGAKAWSYTYDASGRRTVLDATSGAGRAKNTVKTTYGFGSGNRLTSVETGGKAGSLAWDAYGRQVQDQRGTSYEYGLANEVISIAPAGGAVEAMTYDAEGNRITRNGAGGVDVYVTGFIPGQVLHHAMPGGASEDLVLTPGGTVVASIDKAGEVRPVLKNITGSPYRIGAAAGDLLAREFTAFGQVVSDSGGSSSELGFHQMWSAGVDDVQVAGARVYDPDTGRFMAPDPLLFGSSPRTFEAMDLYRYAENNPVARADPTGFAPAPHGGAGGHMAPGLTGYGCDEGPCRYRPLIARFQNPKGGDAGTDLVSEFESRKDLNDLGLRNVLTDDQIAMVNTVITMTGVTIVTDTSLGEIISGTTFTETGSPTLHIEESVITATPHHSFQAEVITGGESDSSAGSTVSSAQANATSGTAKAASPVVPPPESIVDINSDIAKPIAKIALDSVKAGKLRGGGGATAAVASLIESRYASQRNQRELDGLFSDTIIPMLESLQGPATTAARADPTQMVYARIHYRTVIVENPGADQEGPHPAAAGAYLVEPISLTRSEGGSEFTRTLRYPGYTRIESHVIMHVPYQMVVPEPRAVMVGDGGLHGAYVVP